MSASLYTWRKVKNVAALSLSIAAALFGLMWLVWILWTTITKGMGSLNLDLFTQMTPPPNEPGGLANALFGSVVISLLAILLGTPIGIAAGTYLAEYANKHWLGETVRFVNDILLSAPSIVLGLFIYTVMVAQMGHYSAWAGAVALAFIALPVIVRTAVEGHHPSADALGAAGHRHRHPAGAGAHQRRNRAAAVHRLQQPVLEHGPQPVHGQPAHGDLPVRDEPVRLVELAGLGRRLPRHRHGAGAQPDCANHPSSKQGDP
jgi:hypothetical protein